MDACALQGGIVMQVGQDRFWPRDALQVLWRCCADLQDALNDRQL